MQKKVNKSTIADIEKDLFFDNSLDLLCIIDFEGNFIKANKQWEKTLGWTTEDIESNKLIDFVHPDDKEDAAYYLSLARTMNLPNAENRWIKSNGSYCWLLWNSVCLPEQKHIYAIFRDNTLQKNLIQKLEEKRRRYSLATRAADTGIWDWMIQSNEVYFSSTWKAQVGYARDELDNSFETLQSLLHPDDYERVQKEIAAYIEHPTEIFETEYRLLHKDGCYRWIRNRAASLIGRDNKAYRMLGTHRDVTEQKAFEEELHEARKRAEIANIYKNNFLANMSHEIRTPMNGIVGFAELLKDNDLDDEERARYIHIINDNCNVLLNLIDDIIDVSKIEANEVNLQENQFSLCDLMAELREFYDKYKARHKKSNIELKVTIPDYSHNDFVETDHYRLRQVLNNLISNAIKFTHEGFVEFGYTITNSDFIQFFVKDTGIGVEKDKVEHIFGRFQQSDESITRKYGGTGLGLSISRGLVNLLGGKIWLESEQDIGSIFYFNIRYKPVEPLELNMPDLRIPIKELNLKGANILIVEDIDYNFEYLAQILKSTQANIDWAIDGETAIIMIRSGIYDLVFLDLKLPGLTGIDVIKAVKTPDLKAPIIAQTAYAFQEQIDDFMQYGFDDYLIKPIQPEEILAVVSKYV